MNAEAKVLQEEGEIFTGANRGNREPQRPILRYHGGKWVLAPWIIAHFPEHRIYVESFGGAASVLLQKPRTYAEVYNDLDGEVCNLFRMARDRGEELRRVLADTPFARDEFLESYETAEDRMEQARRTVVRSFMGFGSASASGAKTGFRGNANRSGTTPAHDWRNLPEAFEAVCERLRGVVIENRDYQEVARSYDEEGVLHYFDPPYHLDTRKMKNPYCKKGYRFELTHEMHVQFCEFVKTLRGFVVVSGYPHALYDEMFAGWRTVTRRSLADGARERTEVLWFSPNVKEEVRLL